MAQNELNSADDLEKAKRNFEKAAQCCSQGRFNAAEDFLLKGIKACPTHSESYRLLGQVYMNKGELEKAENAVIEALHIDPKNMWALILMGNILVKNKDKADIAEQYYQKVLEYYPDNAIAWNNVGGAHLQREHYDEALPYFEKALALDDTYMNSYYGIALCYYQKGESRLAFDWASRGAWRGVNRVEDMNVRQEVLKLMLTAARDICNDTDYESKVMGVAKDLEAKYGTRIKFTVEPGQDTLAHLKVADFYHTDVNEVCYKRSGFYCHAMLHELMHLDMMMSAKAAGTLKVIGYRQENFEQYFAEYKRHYDLLKRDMAPRNVESLAKQLFNGMSLQTMNCPLDLYVEQKIYDMEEFRPLQVAALFDMESSNIDSVQKTANVAQFPQQVKDVNKQLCIVQGMMLRKLYSIDFIAHYKPSQHMLEVAQDFFGRFELSLDNFAAGDEYKLFDYVATHLGVIKYFTVTDAVPANKQGSSDELKTEAERKQEDFDKTHAPGNVNPGVTMAVAMYMLGAMKYFETLMPEEVKKVAFEVAMLGQNGINPNSTDGYDLKSIPGKHFSGYELLAYYYVSWAEAFPEMLEKLNLPFDDAYEMAKCMFKEGK